MNIHRIRLGLLGLTLVCASLCASCTLLHTADDGHGLATLKTGGHPSKGTPTPIVLNEAVPLQTERIGGQWTRSVRWKVTDDIKGNTPKCYTVDFSVYTIDVAHHKIEPAPANTFALDVETPGACGAAGKHYVGTPFHVTIKATGSPAPMVGGTYLLVGTCVDDTGEPDANKGSGAYLFQYEP